MAETATITGGGSGTSAAGAPGGVPTQPADPLAQLRDIHLPPEPALWPPAPGWWFLLGLTIVLVWLAIRLRGRWRRRRLARLAVEDARASLARLRARHRDGAPAETIAAELSVLVRRVALTFRPRAEVAGLCGRRWAEYLARSSGDDGFLGEPGRFLLDGPYRARGAGSGSREAQVQCLALVDAWIDKVSAGNDSEA